MESNRTERITALYQRESARLQRAVERRVLGDAVIAEDACAFAWATLVGRTDVDPDSPTVFGLLLVIATHEAWRIARQETAGFDADQVERLDVISPVSVEDLAEMHADVALIAQLSERQQQVMTAAALGLGREQMAEALGWTLRTVDRQLARARARLRELRG